MTLALPWAVLCVEDSLFAVPCDHVRSILALNDIQNTLVPNQQPYMRGMMRLYGEAVPLMDMRRRLGFRPLADDVSEFTSLMVTREQDHIKWLDTLERSVKEKTDFTLARDPKMCAFGKWYYKYVPNLRPNSTLRSILEQFEAPHSRIHGVAEQVLQLASHNDQEGALALIEEKKTRDLKRMIRLFERVKDEYQIRHREVAVVLAEGDRLFALIVDEVSEIISLSDEQLRPIDAVMSSHKNAGFISGVAEVPERELMFFTLDVARL